MHCMILSFLYLQVKSEVEEESIPVKEEETTRGLRRRSSKQVFDDDEEK